MYRKQPVYPSATSGNRGLIPLAVFAADLYLNRQKAVQIIPKKFNKRIT